MSPLSDEVFATPELLSEILSYLPAPDLHKFRKIDRTWRATIDAAPTLRRIRCLRPLAWPQNRYFRDSTSTTTTRYSAPITLSPQLSARYGYPPLARKVERGIWERCLHYPPLRIHPALDTFRRGVEWNYWFERDKLEVHRGHNIAHPPIASIVVAIFFENNPQVLPPGRYFGAKPISTVLLRVKSGITLGHVIDIVESMCKTDKEYVLRSPRNGKYYGYMHDIVRVDTDPKYRGRALLPMGPW